MYSEPDKTSRASGTSRLTSEDRVTEFLLLLGCTILVFSFAIVGAATVSFWLGGTISELHLIAGLLCSGVYCFGFARSARTQLNLVDACLSFMTFLGIFAACAIAVNFVFDISWDGQAYHQDAIIALEQGWNPVYQEATTAKYPGWVNHYPKSPWILAAALYKTIKLIESAKAFNLLLPIASFLLVAPTLLITTNLPRVWVWLTASLLALNPISIGQIFNFYIDTQVASLLLALGSICCLLAAQTHFANLLVFPFLGTICLLVNVKFTALVYAVIFVFSLLVWLALTRSKAFYKITLTSALAGLIAIGFFGFNPYLLNTFKHGHPFYPLVGSNTDIISNQIPVDFLAKNRVEKFVRSVFSVSDDTVNATSQLKLPFTVQRKEILAFAPGTARIGGFGVLFSGIIGLAAILIIHSIKRIDRQQIKVYGLISVTLLLSVFINPECWWARYVPQAWFLAPLGIVLALNDDPKKSFSSHSRKFSRFLSCALALVLLINCSTVAVPYLYANVRGTWVITQRLRELAYSPANQLYVHFQSFPSNRLRFEQAGLRFTEVQEVRQLPCKPKKAFFNSDTSFCLKSSS